MDLREEARAKDAIIRYMLDNATHRDQPRMFQPSDFLVIDFGRNLDFSTMERLVKQIISHNKEVVNHLHNLYIESNSYTQQFIDEDGFEGLYNQKQSDLRDEKAAISVTREKDREQLTIVKWQKNTFWFVFVLGLIGGVYSIVKISQFIFLPPNNVTEEQLNPKIDSIQNRLQQLEKGLEQKDKEVDQLREELNKAEMMVRVLEETKP